MPLLKLGGMNSVTGVWLSMATDYLEGRGEEGGEEELPSTSGSGQSVKRPEGSI